MKINAISPFYNKINFCAGKNTPKSPAALSNSKIYTDEELDRCLKALSGHRQIYTKYSEMVANIENRTAADIDKINTEITQRPMSEDFLLLIFQPKNPKRNIRSAVSDDKKLNFLKKYLTSNDKNDMLNVLKDLNSADKMQISQDYREDLIWLKNKIFKKSQIIESSYIQKSYISKDLKEETRKFADVIEVAPSDKKNFYKQIAERAMEISDDKTIKEIWLKRYNQITGKNIGIYGYSGEALKTIAENMANIDVFNYLKYGTVAVR